MLTFKEKYVMEYVYQHSKDKKSCLISPREIISHAADRYVIYPEELEKIMTNLSYDGYIELVKSDKKGKPVFCISLKLKGEGFHRELSNGKRNFWLGLGRSCIFAAIGAACGGVVRLIMLMFGK